MSVSVCMFALSTLRVTKFLLKNFTTTTTTTFGGPRVAGGGPFRGGWYSRILISESDCSVHMTTIIGLIKYFFYVYTVGEFCVLSPSLLMHFFIVE